MGSLVERKIVALEAKVERLESDVKRLLDFVEHIQIVVPIQHPERLDG
jgi:hypothetical protein